MTKVYEFLADGFEDIEALAPVDILRRGGVEIITVSVNGSDYVESAHGVTYKADVKFSDVDLSDATLLLLPGGMPGAKNLLEHRGLNAALLSQAERRGLIGAICAAPMVLGELGLLSGKKATCYPGFESHLHGAHYTHELVTVDGNIITGEGPAAALPYGYRLLAILKGEDVARQIEDGMMYTHLMNS